LLQNNKGSGMARPSTLSAPSQELVLSALRKSKAPLTAYSLLEKLKKTGIKSPPVVYRALDALIKNGAVHKIKALGAFVACNCNDGHTHTLSVLTVCGSCAQVEELHDHAVIDHLDGLRRLKIGLTERAVIELPVTCRACRA
jgi:Fur family zinc uptake transcriptional regulator